MFARCWDRIHDALWRAYGHGNLPLSHRTMLRLDRWLLRRMGL